MNKDELNNLYDNKIMTYIRSISKGQNEICNKWVYTSKATSNNIIKFEAWLVARGFSQKEKEGFDLTYFSS